MRICYDVDTQNDFMDPDGALYVPDAEVIRPNLKILTDYARGNFIPVVGSVDRHFEKELTTSPEFLPEPDGAGFPPHCMDGTIGQKKIYETVVRWEWQDKGWEDESHHYIGNPPIKKLTFDEIFDDDGLCLVAALKNPIHKSGGDEIVKEFRQKVIKGSPEENQAVQEMLKLYETGIDEYGLREAVGSLKLTQAGEKRPFGVFLEKQHYDVFTNPNTEELLKRAGVEEAVLYGVATDYCVKAAALGMRQRGIDVCVVEDAIEGVAEDTTKAALEEMAKAGVVLRTTEEIIKN